MKSLVIAFVCIASVSEGQHVGSALPDPISRKAKFLFYLHGQVVTELGDMAIYQSAPEWGPYEYSHVLDSLAARDVNVISEIRKKGVDNSAYTNKIAAQIDTLLRSKVKPENILVLGASAGWDIALSVSDKLKNPSLHFVAMGGCWPDTYKDYTKLNLTGHFLSLIEKTDPHGTCVKVFEKRAAIKSYREITLNTGLSHGFIYKGHAAWIDPVMAWWRGDLLR